MICLSFLACSIISGAATMKLTLNPGVNASFDRNPNYWKAGHAHFDGVETTIIADSTARNQALLTGQVDCIDDVSAPTAGLLSRNPNVDVLARLITFL